MNTEHKHLHVIFFALGEIEAKTTVEIVESAKESGIDVLEVDETRRSLRYAATLGLVEEIEPDKWLFIGDRQE
jgi:hypothetical protein